jgi:hypothetical protein
VSKHYEAFNLALILSEMMPQQPDETSEDWINRAELEGAILHTEAQDLRAAFGAARTERMLKEQS